MLTGLAFVTIAEICGVVGIAAVLRGLTGFGFALAAVPLLSLVIPPAQAVVIAVLLQCLVGVRDLISLRGQFDRGELGRMGLGALIGTPPGILLLGWLDPDVMRLVIAAIICLAIPMLALPPKPRGAGALRLAFPAGLAGGFFGGLAAMPGPPAITYFLYTGAAAARMRASLMIFVAITAAIALPGLAVTGLLHGSDLVAALCAFPVMLGGTWLGGRLFALTSERRYRLVSLSVLLATALSAGARGLSAML